MVIAAIVAISVYVQRALQARVRDAKIFMVDRAAAGCKQADDESRDVQVNCQGAAGMKDGRIRYEYEPYYAQVNAVVWRAQRERKAQGATGPGTSGFFRKQFDDATEVESTSVQSPPKDAN